MTEVLDETIERYEERMLVAACDHRWQAFVRVPVPAVMDADLTSEVHRLIDRSFDDLSRKPCPACRRSRTKD